MQQASTPPSKPRNPPTQRDKSKQQPKSPDNSPQPPIFPDTPRSNFVYEPSTCECPAKSEPQSTWKKAISPESWPNWLLVGVGAVGTWLALRSLRVGEKAAQAAQLNAQAVIDAERAWVLIPQEKIQSPYLSPWEQESVSPSDLRLTHCIFWIKNGGKTPAKIIMEMYEMQIGDSRVTPPAADRVYNLATSKGFNPYLIPQDEITPREAGLMTGVVTPSEHKMIKQDKIKFLWLCGFIRYQDVFNAQKKEQEHETRFCYLWETHMNTPEPFWHVAGPAEYNKTT
jgi:hypothetical protein